MKLSWTIHKDALDEVMIFPAGHLHFSKQEYAEIDEWCKANIGWYYILMEDYVLFTNDDDVLLFLLTWSD
jgi:hypothetical protein